MSRNPSTETPAGGSGSGSGSGSRVRSATEDQSAVPSAASNDARASKENEKDPTSSLGALDLVGFDGEADLLNPQNWPTSKKVCTTALWALTTCWITFASAVYSAGTREISEEFDVSLTTATAGTSLLIFGFAIGPLLWAPLCEVYGRKWTALAVRVPPSPHSVVKSEEKRG